MATEVNLIVGSSGNQQLPGIETYEQVYEIIYDDPVYDSAIPLSDPNLPPYQTLYASWSRAVHVARTARQSNSRAAPHVWTVTCQYSSQRNDSQQNMNQDPELDLPRISWTSQEVQVYRERDLNGNRKCNSAGEPFIPITPRYETVKVATVRYFVREKPIGLMELVNKINSNAFVVDGESVYKHCCRIAGIQCGEPRIERGVVGRDITVQFQVGPVKQLGKANYIDQIGAASTVETNISVGYWISESLDRGRREVISTAGGAKLQLIQDSFGNEPSEPSLLDGKGASLTTPVAVNDEVYRYWYDYEEADFSLIRLQ
jgi:hypothetical protein